MKTHRRRVSSKRNKSMRKRGGMYKQKMFNLEQQRSYYPYGSQQNIELKRQMKELENNEKQRIYALKKQEENAIAKAERNARLAAAAQAERNQLAAKQAANYESAKQRGLTLLRQGPQETPQQGHRYGGIASLRRSQ
jgi:hypothetical protein